MPVLTPLIIGVFALMTLIGYSAPLSAQAALTTWRVTEAWRVDGTESGEPFGDLRDYAIGKDGSLWALDFKDQTIRHFDANGRSLGIVGRKGSGPGEMRNANGIVVQTDGSVWVVDPSNARLTVFDATGKFHTQYSNPTGGYGYRWEAWIDRKTGDLMDQFLNMKSGQESSSMDWRRVNPNGVVRDTIKRPSCATDNGAPRVFYRGETKGKGATNGAYPFTYGGGMAPDGNGGMWCATATSKRVALVRIGKGDTIATTTVDVPPVRVDKTERDDAISAIQKRLSTYATNDFDPSKVPSTKPGITALTVDDDGRLWVQHVRIGRERAVTFDVHDRTGKHVARVRFPMLPSAEGLPIRARGNHVWLAVRDDDDVVSIAKFTLSK
jgi:streptogramin lyase